MYNNGGKVGGERVQYLGTDVNAKETLVNVVAESEVWFTHIPL